MMALHVLIMIFVMILFYSIDDWCESLNVLIIKCAGQGLFEGPECKLYLFNSKVTILNLLILISLFSISNSIEIVRMNDKNCNFAIKKKAHAYGAKKIQNSTIQCLIEKTICLEDIYKNSHLFGLALSRLLSTQRIRTSTIIDGIPLVCSYFLQKFEGKEIKSNKRQRSIIGKFLQFVNKRQHCGISVTNLKMTIQINS